MVLEREFGFLLHVNLLIHQVLLLVVFCCVGIVKFKW